jgi:hypothetical protein
MEQPIFSHDCHSNSLRDLEAKFLVLIESMNVILCGEIENKNILEDIKSNCETQLKRVARLIRLDRIRHCKHEYESDLFDTDPESSIVITYCIHCEHIL